MFFDLMTTIRFRLAIVLAALASAANPATAQKAAAGRVPVLIETSLGAVTVVLDSAHAPNTVANFLRYVDAKLYDKARFHRTVVLTNQPNNAVKIEVIQAGVDTLRKGDVFAPITLERTSVTGLHHVDGTLSMARGGPDTAAEEFFICIGAQPELDFGGKRNPDGQGFAAFGQVTKGMDVVRRIQQSPADGQRLTPPITIVRITRIK
jgi:peptidyl-prolyl cis-trans isomerase A (cyclophilin A)